MSAAVQFLDIAHPAAPAEPPDTPLDEPAQWAAFSRVLPGREGWYESTLAVEGMHCAACALAVEAALARLPGVESVQVNGATRLARLAWSPAQSKPSHWLAAVRAAGYAAFPAGDATEAARRTREQRTMLWRWLVAGFSMMQVMMYAFPAYTAGEGEITPDIQRLLAWASWMLTIPAVVFSSWPFFASAWRDLRNRRLGMDVPVALGILVAFGASTVTTFDPLGPPGADAWYDSVTMFVFFLLSGRLLEQRLRDRTAGALESLARRLPQTVQRRRADGSFERVGIGVLVRGDVVRVLAGEAVPADGVVLEGRSQIDEALLTGESKPRARQGGDAVVAGTHNLGGTLAVRVERTGKDTRFAQIVALMEEASVQRPRLARAADRIAGPFLLLVLVAAAAAAGWWWPVDPSRALGVAIAVLIVTCPCALSLATPAATLAAAGALARRGILVRRLQALEDAARVDTVVFDKTGTLTQDALRLADVSHRPLVNTPTVLAWAGALAQHSLHPVSRAIAAAAPGPLPQVEDVHEIGGSGVSARLGTQVLRLGSAAFCRVPGGTDGKLQAHLADDAGWIATFEFGESVRPDAAPAVIALGASGLEVQLLSGDREDAVRRVAFRTGIAVARGSCTPEDKLRHVQTLQQTGRRVAMVGDGLNDGPVLARADASIAMGTAAPLAQARADFIVPGGQVGAVPAILGLARRTQRVVRQNLAWAALYNAVCVPLAVLGAMPPWLAGLGMAASSLLVVANAARLAREER